MYNPLSYGQDSVINNTATITLGYGPGNMAPPRELLQNVTQGSTVNLPPISTGQPSPPGTLAATIGVGDGYMITIRNLQNNPVTVTPNGSDTADTLVLGASGFVETLMASIADTKWHRMSTDPRTSAIRKYTTSATLAASDRYLVNASGSGTVTLQTASLYPVGVPYTIKPGLASQTITVTPATGVVWVAAGGTAAGASVTTAPISFVTDGTDFFIL